MAQQTFADLEHAGWQAKASAYDAGVNTITRTIFPSILNHLGGDLANRRVLDICAGTGELTAALAALGADATGLDFSEAMVALAAEKYPLLTFKTGDAQNLRLDANSFDDVVCSFGLLHLPDPDQAIAEAARVLKPGGRYLFTVWNNPDQNGGFMKIIMSAIADHGSPDVDLPPAPPAFRLADPSEAQRALAAAGFDNTTVEVVDAQWCPATGQEVLDMIYRSMVRIPMLLDAQPPKARDKIEAAIISSSEATRDGATLVISTPATLVTATKHSD
jgi:ubiquinone/menaquinone biosynthesis C-methylase UbiE